MEVGCQEQIKSRNKIVFLFYEMRLCRSYLNSRQIAAHGFSRIRDYLKCIAASLQHTVKRHRMAHKPPTVILLKGSVWRHQKELTGVRALSPPIIFSLKSGAGGHSVHAGFRVLRMKVEISPRLLKCLYQTPYGPVSFQAKFRDNIP